MGYQKVPSWKHYWHNNPYLLVLFISDVLHCNRFLQILSNIHVNDNNAIPGDKKDEFYKLSSLIDITIMQNYTVFCAK